MPDTRQPSRGIVFVLAHVTIELSTPLTIGTGNGDDLNDSTCVLDTNGLPTIPGTSLAGMLRAAWRTFGLQPEDDTVFGFQKKKTGASSLVEVSWAATHDQYDRPVLPLAPTASLESDPVLACARAGVVRDHVRINHRGVADGAGKFDELLVPAGARFSFELLVHGSQASPIMERLLALLHRGGLRLGGRTRRGFGAFSVQTCSMRTFDLRKPEHRSAMLQVPRDLSTPGAGLPPVSLDNLPQLPRDTHRVTIALSLIPQDYWLFGTGLPVRDEHYDQRKGDKDQRKGDKDQRKPHDKVPVTERRIVWPQGRGTVTSSADAEVLVPASGIKGALRHRTLFHARRRKGYWALGDKACSPDHLGQQRAWAEEVKALRDHGARLPDPIPDPLQRQVGDTARDLAEEAVDQLFGSIKSAQKEGHEEAQGTPGRVFLSDLYLADARSAPLQHVSLDRFTQGPMDGLLYSEAPIARFPALNIQLIVDTADLPDLSRRALADALADLAEGRLALGAGANRGHGYFEDPTLDLSPLVPGGEA